MGLVVQVSFSEGFIYFAIKTVFVFLYLGLDSILVLSNEGQYVETWYITAYTYSQEC